MTRILVLHGINLNMFGKRDPKQYGTTTLAEIDERLEALGRELDVAVECFQSNSEGAFCERIHRVGTFAMGAVVVNAGAWTHYSYGIRDALAILACPVIEVHMSNMSPSSRPWSSRRTALHEPATLTAVEASSSRSTTVTL